MIGFEFAGALLLVRLIAAVIFLNLYIRDRKGRNLVLFSGWILYAAGAAARFLLTVAPYEALVFSGIASTGGIAIIGLAALAYVESERQRFYLPVFIFTVLSIPVFLIFRKPAFVELLFLLLQAGVILLVFITLIRDRLKTKKPRSIPYTSLYLAFGLGTIHITLIATGFFPSSISILVTLVLNMLLMLFFIYAEHSIAYTEIQHFTERMRQAERTAGIGYWERGPQADKPEWTDGVFRIFEIPADNGAPSESELIRLAHPEDRKLLKDHISRKPIDSGLVTFEYRIKTSEGSWKWIFEEKSRDPQTGYQFGFIQDISRIKEYQQSLEQSIKEKDVLIKEIHHRVKNNLQIVISLFSLKKDGVKDRTARRVMKDMETRLQSMAKIHDILLAVDNLASIEISIYLEDLARQIFSLYKRPGWNIELEIQIEKDIVPVDTALPCCLLAAECITNACSHAFPEEVLKNRKPLSILLSYSAKGGSRVLSVCDNGIGLPAELLDASGTERPGTEAEAAPALGLVLIDNFAAQIGGSVKRSAASDGGGTCITVTFPG